MKRFKLINVILLIVSISSCIQNGKPSKQKFFGQMEPGITPEIFAPGIISTNACELHGTFSPDGKEFFFTRRDSIEHYNNRIMYSQYQNGKWTTPQLAPFAKDCIELFAHFSLNGNKLFFLSEREHPITGKLMKNDEKIWYSVKTDKRWGDAHFLNSPLNEGWLLSVVIAQDDIIYVSGEYGNQGGIFRSIPSDGKYQSVEYLVNGSHPYVSPDESYIIYDRFDQNGNSALYVSFRDSNGQFTEPIKLDPEINATNSEAFAEVSPDGKFLFFYRQGDIYWVDAKIIKNLNPKK